jgi:uncharacterized protein YqeY
MGGHGSDLGLGKNLSGCRVCPRCGQGKAGGVVAAAQVAYLRHSDFCQGMVKTMGLRARITDGIKTAMREKDAARLGTLRLISAAIKDKDIEARGDGKADGVSDADVLAILGKMVKQRQESARAYEEGGRLELAEQEREEIAIIEDYLPRQLSGAEVEAAVAEAITETGADSVRDMGRVMGALKSKYTGRMDFGAVGPMVKARLG